MTDGQQAVTAKARAIIVDVVEKTAEKAAQHSGADGEFLKRIASDIGAAKAVDMPSYLTIDCVVAALAYTPRSLRNAADELRALAALIVRPPLDDVLLSKAVALRSAEAIATVLASLPDGLAVSMHQDSRHPQCPRSA